MPQISQNAKKLAGRALIVIDKKAYRAHSNSKRDFWGLNKNED